jgi:hypothetical protein
MKNLNILKDLEDYIKNMRSEDKRHIEHMISSNNALSYKDFTYGTTPYETAITLIDSVSKKYDRFVVVGASIGWMNFYFNDKYPDIETLGIDIHRGRIRFGKSLIKKYNLSNISLDVDDLYKFEFKSTDLIWMSNCCFDKNSFEDIFNKIIGEHPEISIISYKPFSGAKYKRYKLPVSWMENQPFWVYDEK